MADDRRDAPSGIDQEIDARGIVKVGVWLTAITVAGFVIAWGFYLLLLRGERRLDAPPSPIAEAQAARPVPGPALQGTPERDLSVLRSAERARLDGWSWVDRDAGIAQVPIDVALERVAAAGALPDFSRPLEISTP